MGLTTEILSGGSGVSKEVLGGVGGSLAAFGTLFKTFIKVETGEMGIKTRFGKVQYHRFGDKKDAVKKVGPGLHPVFPFTHSINKVDVRDRSSDLEAFEIDLKTGQYVVRSSVFWHVSAEDDNPYRALYNIANDQALTAAVTNRCGQDLRASIHDLPAEQIHQSDVVFEAMRQRGAESLGRYGVELTELQLHTVAKSIGEKLCGQTCDLQGALPNLSSRLAASGALDGLNSWA